MTSHQDPPHVAIEGYFPDIWSLLESYRRPWAIAGGWAVDLHLGRVTRHHGDLEIAALRRDQFKLYDLFAGWSVFCVDSGKIQPWLGSVRLELPIHQVRVTSPRGETLDILLNEASGDRWLYRRDQRITMALEQAIRVKKWPYLTPEIVLLFKAKQPAAKDMADLELVLPTLTPQTRSWLKNAIELAAHDRAWLDRLNQDTID